jgi:hypothetical protein
MNLRSATAGACLLALTLGLGVEIAFPRKSPDDEAKLLSVLEREKNPVKKAKLETRLGRLKLQQAFSAYDQGQFDLCWKLFDDYLGHMKSAWTDLGASGREAARHPDGFKQLDIALRESGRDLEDFQTRVTFQEREAVDKIHAQTADLHNHVLDALFPGGIPAKKKGALAGKRARDSNSGKGPR